MKPESTKSEVSMEQQLDGTALESAGRYHEAAVEYRRELEQLNEDDGSAVEMADLALSIARCLEQLGDEGGAEAARKLAASFCARRLDRRGR